MSVSTEVQRTLVKSPPELWAELGDVDGLTRHLGEIGEIRVTKVEPETRVEWEADLASGFVELKQSGWGTKVTLSLTRELPDVETETPVEPVPAEPVSAEPEPAEPEPVVEVAAEPEPAAEAEAVVVAEASEPETTTIEPKQRFFARFFKRRKVAGVQAEPAPEPIAQMQPEAEPSVELHAMALPDPVYPDPPPEAAEPAADLGVELAELEAQMKQESTELLTGVLDRLGAAHHRPFSRA